MLFNGLLPDHDAGVFNPPTTADNERGISDVVVSFLFGGLGHWDAVYFLHVSQHGYTYENTLAFFPLLPMLTQLVASTIFYPLSSFLCVENVLLVSGAAVNFFAFIGASVILNQLTLEMFGNSSLASRTTTLFCFNPASIFFSAVYSESLFVLFTFLGLYFLYKNQDMMAVLVFGLSALTRSNGLVNFGFILFKNAVALLSAVDLKDPLQTFSRLMSTCATSVLQLCVGSFFFLLFHLYTFSLFCLNDQSADEQFSDDVIQYGIAQNYKFPEYKPAEWCSYSVPLAYTYVQKEYWNVGLFQYYEFKQIPNFLLATPMVVISTCAIVYYVENNLSLWVTSLTGDVDVASKKDDNVSVAQIRTHYLSPRVFVYVAHLTFLLLVAVTTMHVQVSETRQ